MRFLVALALLAVAARSGAGQSAHPYDLFLSDWRPPPGQRCDLGEAPALSALVDTAALFQRLGAVLERRVPAASRNEDDAVPVRLLGVVNVHQQSESGIHPVQYVRLDTWLRAGSEQQGSRACEGG